ncbi:MAG: transposase, partial [Bacteroidota bacterium]
MDCPQRTKEEVFRQGNYQINAEYELAYERALHEIKTGPRFLAKPVIATLILDSWKNLQEREQAYVYAVCVMSNHVHVLLQEASAGKKLSDLGKLMNNHKGYTARMANRILNRTGQGFWDRTYFDRRVRQGKFTRVMWYVLNNPVKAGLVSE